MPRVQYIGNESAHVSGLPAFQPGEERDVDEETAQVLLRNPHFARVVEKARRSVIPDESKGD